MSNGTYIHGREMLDDLLRMLEARALSTLSEEHAGRAMLDLLRRVYDTPRVLPIARDNG